MPLPGALPGELRALRPYLAEYWFERPAELEQLDADVRALIAEHP